MYYPVRVLGQGHNSTVYEAIANAEHFAVRVGSSHCVHVCDCEMLVSFASKM